MTTKVLIALAHAYYEGRSIKCYHIIITKILEDALCSRKEVAGNMEIVCSNF